MKTKPVIVRGGLIGVLIGLFLAVTTESPSIVVSLLMGLFVVSIFGLFGILAGVLLLAIMNLRKNRHDGVAPVVPPNPEFSSAPGAPPSQQSSPAARSSPTSIQRWIDLSTASEGAHELGRQIADIKAKVDQEVPAPPRRWKWIATIAILGVVVAFFVLVIGLTSKAGPRQGPPNYPLLVLFVGGIMTLAGGVTYWITSRFDEKRAGRFESFRDIKLRYPTIAPLYRAEVTTGAPGGFPWFYDETGDGERFAWATGEYKELQFHWIEVQQTIDPVMAQEPGLARSIGSIAEGKGRRMTVRAADTIVFTSPLTNLPDFFLQPKLDANSGYLREHIGNEAIEIPLPEFNKKTFIPNPGMWAITSDAAFADRLVTPELKEQLGRHPVYLQVVGGFVAIHQATWLPHYPTGRVSAEQDVIEYLDSACRIYNALRHVEAQPISE